MGGAAARARCGESGYERVILKTGGEPAPVQLAGAMKKHYPHDMLFETPPAHDPQSNGIALEDVQDILAQARSLRVPLEQRLAGRIDVDSSIIECFLEHAAWVINNHQEMLAKDAEVLGDRGGDVIPPPMVVPEVPKRKRDFEITRQIVEVYGETLG